MCGFSLFNSFGSAFCAELRLLREKKGVAARAAGRRGARERTTCEGEEGFCVVFCFLLLAR